MWLAWGLLRGREDKDVIVQAGQFARGLMMKPPLAEFVDTIVDPPPEAMTDAQIEAYARERIYVSVSGFFFHVTLFGRSQSSTLSVS